MKLSRNRWLAVLIGLVVVADWTTKFLIRNAIPQGTRRTMLDGWLSFQHNVNTGIAWGWLTDLPQGLRMPLLAALALVGIGATVSIIRQSKDRWIHLAGALVLGGAVGNLGDRLMQGGVTDFIFVHFFPYVFNVADIAISIGGVLLVLRMMLDRRPADAAPTHA